MGNPYSHLEAIELRLSNERSRLALATTSRERTFREQQIAMAEKERLAEVAFLEARGIDCKPLTLDEIMMSDDELLSALA